MKISPKLLLLLLLLLSNEQVNSEMSDFNAVKVKLHH